jgi:hypothetical protein
MTHCCTLSQNAANRGTLSLTEAPCSKIQLTEAHYGQPRHIASKYRQPQETACDRRHSVVTVGTLRENMGIRGTLRRTVVQITGAFSYLALNLLLPWSGAACSLTHVSSKCSCSECGRSQAQEPVSSKSPVCKIAGRGRRRRKLALTCVPQASRRRSMTHVF